MTTVDSWPKTLLFRTHTACTQKVNIHYYLGISIKKDSRHEILTSSKKSHFQSAYYLESEGLVYATFTTPENSIAGSAICSFNISEVDQTFRVRPLNYLKQIASLTKNQNCVKKKEKKEETLLNTVFCLMTTGEVGRKHCYRKKAATVGQNGRLSALCNFFSV